MSIVYVHISRLVTLESVFVDVDKYVLYAEKELVWMWVDQKNLNGYSSNLYPFKTGQKPTNTRWHLASAFNLNVFNWYTIPAQMILQ